MMYRLHGLLMMGVSLIYNAVYWCVHHSEWESTVDSVEAEEKRLKGLKDVRILMSSFEWTSDGIIDWQPWVETIFNRRFRDDCDGAAVLGKWALEQIGIKSRIVRLWAKGKVQGHSVCVSEDNRIMISNSDVIELDGIYPGNLYAYFGNDFNVMT